MIRKFFISHRSSDKVSALDLERKLNKFSVAKAWVDNFELEAGDSLSRIKDSIKECDVLIVLWTEETNISDWVKKEIELGQNYDLRIINCVIHRSLFQQPYVRNTVCIDYSLEELGFGHLCLKEIAPLLFLGPECDEVIRRYRGYVKSVIQGLHSEDGIWDNEKYRVWLKESFTNLKELGNRSVASLGGSVGDRALFYQQMDSLQKKLLEFLKTPGAQLEQIDIKDILPPGVTKIPVISSEETDLPPVPGTNLAAQLASLGAPPQILANEQLLKYYIESSKATLARMNVLIEQEESQAGRVVVAELNRYLQDPYDIFPEAQFGELGLLDDALMIHNVAFRLIESRIVSVDTFPVHWEQIIHADQIARMVLPEQVVFQLEGLITQYVGLICTEFAGYHPAATSYGGADRFLMPLENEVRGFF